MFEENFIFPVTLLLWFVSNERANAGATDVSGNTLRATVTDCQNKMFW